MLLRPAVLVLLAVFPALRGQTPWSVARAGNFEVYSHRSGEEARAALLWLEQLRAIVKEHLGLDAPGDCPVSVFGFPSRHDYEPYRLRATSDAYYVGTDGRNYIVLPTLGPESYATIAHEYAHLVSHAAGAHIPPWLGEGLADVFSTIRVTRSGPRLGGEPFGRIRTLRYRQWLPLETLLALPADAPLRNARAGSDIFYAESWALTDMLLMSSEYGPHFSKLAAALSNSPASSAVALAGTYGKPLAGIMRDLQDWVRRHRSRPMLLGPAPAAGDSGVESAELPDVAVRTRLAAMLLAAGDSEAAASIFRQAALETPDDPSVLAGLAAIALAKGRPDESRGLFARALSGGLADADLCYRYATLLDGAGRPLEERRAALTRAVASQPGFDDARYALALVEKNLGNDEAAVAQLRAMRSIAPARAYHYWAAMADALIGAGRNQEAVSAARKASELASDPDEQVHAARLAETAQTHLAVRFVRDGSGGLHLATTRAPNGATDWNPFIEPTDDIRRAEGKLLEIDCSGPVIRMIVDTATGRVIVAIPDPAHVQMRNAPPEFVCGPQEPVDIAIQYDARSGLPNADGIARGIEFR